jgi:hypothetical protein
MLAAVRIGVLGGRLGPAGGGGVGQVEQAVVVGDVDDRLRTTRLPCKKTSSTRLACQETLYVVYGLVYIYIRILVLLMSVTDT